jgi:hypothetical protein
MKCRASLFSAKPNAIKTYQNLENDDHVTKTSYPPFGHQLHGRKIHLRTKPAIHRSPRGGRPLSLLASSARRAALPGTKTFGAGAENLLCRC